MAPSTALRYSPRGSPRRGLRGGDTHKRGRSLESGLSFKGKEDDGLALFDEMQKKERDSFLLDSNDELEDLFGKKLKYFSDCKIGLTVSTRGDSSDMLNAEGEKHDYDWLLTPPDTPLFPSLDDEAPPGNLVQRGRPRSLPIPISRSSSMEKNYKGRSSIGSPSPQRFSPSPKLGTSSSQQSRGRTSPAPSSSPTPSLRNSSPSRKPSPPPVKSSTSGHMSSTPTTRRLSTGSSGTGTTVHGRGSSPVHSSRAISSSPKVGACQSNIPGFPTEVPSNLRTSLADRPASYVRGSSPASRNGKDAPVKVKLSMSPTDHKSITSSIIHDRERLSSYSKEYLISSGDVETESLHSNPISTSDFSRRAGTQSNNKAISYSRKSNKMVMSSSAPKRSFDNGLRHMDQRKTPQNMFRPLLSSVPTTTLYAGKPMPAHEAMFSRNSSMATGSTASSDQAFGLALEMEDRYARQDAVMQYEDKPDTNVPEEVFVLDKMDGMHSDAGTEIDSFGNQRGLINEGIVYAIQHGIDEDISYNDSIITQDAVSKVKSNASESLEEGTPGDVILCSECGCKYASMDNASNEANLCPECSRKDIDLQVCFPEKSVAEVCPGADRNHPDNHSMQNDPEEDPSLSSCVELTTPTDSSQCEGSTIISEPNFRANSNSYVDNSLARSLVEVVDRKPINPHEVFHRRVGSGQPENEDAGQFMPSSDTSSSYFNDSEVDGISILLNSSSSIKGPIYQGRVFKASSNPYDDPSYARESGSFTRSTMGLGSTSASSSVDLSSNRQIETRMQRQSSSKKIESEIYRLKRTGSHSSETSNQAYQISCHSLNLREDEFEACSGNEYMENKFLRVQEKLNTSGSTEMHDIIGSKTSCFSEVLGCNIISGGSSVTSNDEKSVFYEHGEAIEKDILITDGYMLASESEPIEDISLLQKYLDSENTTEICTHRSLHSVSEIEYEIEQESNHESENDNGLTKLDTVSETPTLSVANLSEKMEAISVEEVDPYNDELGASESTVVIKTDRGNHTRSLTLEEATDTILFCRSLVQNIVDQAATIAIEKEKSPPSEPPRPILAKTNLQRKEPWGRSPNSKHTPKAKPKQKQTQAEEPKPHLSKSENDENIEQLFPQNVGHHSKNNTAVPPKLESKCNCTIM